MSQRLLVVHHSPTAALERLLQAVVDGASDPEIRGVEVVVRDALEATADDVLAADGVVLGTTANFGYMSGALKHFFDSTFLAAGGAIGDDGQGSGSATRRPFGLYVHGRYDTTGAARSVHAIAQALGWVAAYEDVSVLGEVTEEDCARARDLGATIAALVMG